MTKANGAARRRGPPVLLAAKFLPGLGLMMPPLIGQARVPYLRFLAFDAVGASLWALFYIGVGRALGGAIGRSGSRPDPVRGWGSALFASALVVAVIAGVVRRYRYGRQGRPSEPRSGAGAA